MVVGLSPSYPPVLTVSP
uniref:Uncharacterized protein n=1 Tax=Anguilla anguilla TaxID=7936 RepID=A0A0E9UJ60_ANGAN